MRKIIILFLIIFISCEKGCLRDDIKKIIPHNDTNSTEVLYKFQNTFDQDCFKVYSIKEKISKEQLLKYPLLTDDYKNRKIIKWHTPVDFEEKKKIIEIIYSSFLMNDDNQYKNYLLEILNLIKLQEDSYFVSYSVGVSNNILLEHLYFPNKNILYSIEPFIIGYVFSPKEDKKVVDSILYSPRSR